MCAVSHRVPSISPHFESVRRALKGWTRQVVPRQATPITRPLVFAYLGWLVGKGDYGLALCIALAWGGLLRAQETLCLQVDNVALPGNTRLSDCAPHIVGVLVRYGKTGRMQVALIDDCSVLPQAQSSPRHATF